MPEPGRETPPRDAPPAPAPPTGPPAVAPPPRRAPALAAGALLVLVVVLAALLVPLDVLPGADPVVDVGRDFTSAEQQRAATFAAAVEPPAYASLVLGLVVSGVLGLTRLGSRLVTAVARPLGGGWAWQVLLGTAALAVVGRLATLPLSARVEAVRRDAGLSTRTWGTWAVDVAKSLAVSALVTALVLLVVVAVARRAPRTWWAWGAGAVAALAAAGSFLYPVVVEPVFNEFTPLPAGALRDDLLALAREEGVPASDVLVADASRRTTALNAYVSGFGSTRRIVLYDTLLAQSTPAEVRLVVAHELGHAANDDVVVGTVLGALGGAAGVCVLAVLLASPRLLRRAGADGPGDPRAVPLALALVASGGLLVSPAVNAVSRQLEQRADLASLETTGDVDTFVAGFRRLALTNVSELRPSPLEVALFSTHPSAPERLAFARAWQEQQR